MPWKVARKSPLLKCLNNCILSIVGAGSLISTKFLIIHQLNFCPKYIISKNFISVFNMTDYRKCQERFEN